MFNSTFNFEEMYKANYNSLCNAVENIIGDESASQDIVQDVFLKIWIKKDELEQVNNKRAYLFKSVINSALKFLEANKGRISFSDIHFAASETSDSSLRQKELEVKIQLAINNLPPKCKTIFCLSRFEEMKNREIAEQLDISLKTVETQMGIALKKMREHLAPYLTNEFLVNATIVSLTILAQFLSLHFILSFFGFNF